MARPEKVRLGELLVQQKVITEGQLNEALESQRRSGRRLGRVFVELGLVTEERLSEALARQMGIPYINLKFYNIQSKVVTILPETMARRFRAIVLEVREEDCLVGMADPTDLFAYDEIVRALRRDISLAVVTETLLLQSIDRIYRRTEEISGLAQELVEDLGEQTPLFSVSELNQTGEDAPVARLLYSVFEDAWQVHASDIHIEPREDRLIVRFRIDGVLHVQNQADIKIAPAVALRLKLISGLDISEKRLPQDGRFNIKLRNGLVDVRLSTMPTPFGESVVMRLLGREAAKGSLAELGMSDRILARMRWLLDRPHGLVLVTGPTGSGKTTTLYAALSELNSSESKIITVEDPIEYRLPGITQVQINEKIGLDFTRVLRSSLRQDPDILLVGEIRDPETAQISMRAALTGHLVLSTLHTNDAAGTPMRLLDMGVPRYMIGMSLVAVIAQRLVRLVCESCAQLVDLGEAELDWLSRQLNGENVPKQCMVGHGCAHCNGMGYQGRIGVYEMLEMNAILLDSMYHSDPSAFSALAYEQMGGETLRRQAVSLVLAGRTTVREAIRVSQYE